jgi:ABC-type transport system involved in multi-copper enzyme maturation permease subunit
MTTTTMDELDEPVELVAPVVPRRRPHPVAAVRHVGVGIAAVGTKELRGRMRGRRAFVILTLYLVLLAGFAWMYELIVARQYSSGFGGSAAFASAAIGQEVFAGLIMLETLLVVLLAPAFTSGAISLEREKQTLDLLVATPISSIAIVIGKLLSALTYVFILIAASIPLTAMVFVFGGVAPDDVVRAYIVLVVTAIGLGSFGLFCSALVKRTQAATVITVFGVLAMTLGSVFVVTFWSAVAGTRVNDFAAPGTGGIGPIKGRPPEVLAYLNPFAAQADIACGTQTVYGIWCSRFSTMLTGTEGFATFGVDQPSFPVIRGVDGGIDIGGREPGVALDRIIPAVVAPQPFGVARDGFWPRSVAAWLVLSLVLLILSVQLVSPTRRWRLRLGRRPSRSPA